MMWALTGTSMKTVSWISEQGWSNNNLSWEHFRGKLHIISEKQDKNMESKWGWGGEGFENTQRLPIMNNLSRRC